MPKSQPSGTVRHALVPLLVGALVAGVLLVSAPAQAQRIRPGFWGMHDVDWTTPPSVPVGSANLTTSGTYWPRSRRVGTRFDWSRLDAQVAAAEAIGAQPMIVLGQTPRFASTRRRSVDYHDYPPKIRLWRTTSPRSPGGTARGWTTRSGPSPTSSRTGRARPARWRCSRWWPAGRSTGSPGEAKIVSPGRGDAAARAAAVAGRLLQADASAGRRVHRYVDAIAIDPFPEQRGTPEDSYALMREHPEAAGAHRRAQADLEQRDQLRRRRRRSHHPDPVLDGQAAVVRDPDLSSSAPRPGCGGPTGWDGSGPRRWPST